MDFSYEIRNEDFFYDDDRNGTRLLNVWNHSHYHIELVCMLDGEVLAYADGEEYLLKAGDIFISFPDCNHKYVSYAKEKYFLFIINPDIMPEITGIFNKFVPSCPVIHGGAFDKKLMSPLRSIIETEKEQKHPCKDIIKKGYMTAFFGELISRLSLVDASSVTYDTLKDILNFCSKNYMYDISLDMIADKFHISKFYISHLFSQKIKMSFKDYINSVRITEACRQLRYSDKIITEIGYAVGFNTLRTFNRAFQKHMNVSPSQYRRDSSIPGSASMRL